MQVGIFVSISAPNQKRAALPNQASAMPGLVAMKSTKRSSPANARHILRALVELEAGQGRAFESVGDLWRELDSEDEDGRKAGTAGQLNEHPRDAQVDKRGQLRVDAPPVSSSASNPRSRGG